MRNPYRQLEKAIGYRFRRRRHLETALTHPSFRSEVEDITQDNQRLEFLGDAVLGLVSGEYLYAEFRDLPEGELTHLRSCLANSRALARIAGRIELGRYLKLGHGEKKSGGERRPSNISDALEAIIGAAYLDGGLKAARRIFAKLFASELHPVLGTSWAGNPKGNLQEISQRKWQTSPHYVIVSEKGPPHSKVFTAEVRVRGKAFGRGEGNTKQAAEVVAAQRALEAGIEDYRF